MKGPLSLFVLLALTLVGLVAPTPAFAQGGVSRAMLPQVAGRSSVPLFRGDDAIEARMNAVRAGLRRAIVEAAPEGEAVLDSLESATLRGDPEAGLLAARALVRSAPNSWAAAQQECVFLAQLRRDEDAIGACQRATRLSERPETLASLALVLHTTDRYDAQRESRILFQNATSRFTDAHDVLVMRCHAALISIVQAQEGYAELEDCSTLVDQRLPESTSARLFSFFAAVSRSQWGRAEQELRAFEARAANAEYSSALRQVLRNSKPWWATVIESAPPWIVGLIALWLLVFLFARAYGRGLLRSLDDPESTRAPSAPPLARRVYGALIRVYAATVRAAVIVLCVSIAAIVARGALWLLYAVGRWYIGYLVTGGLLLLFLAWTMFNASTMSLRFEHIGTDLPLSEHPALDALVRRAAERAGVDAPKELYVTPECNCEVYVVASPWQLGVRPQPLFVRLGAGLLGALSADELEALLVNEFARAQRNENPGGAVSLALSELFARLASKDPGGWVGALGSMIRSLALGASRAQEFIADRIAAQAFDVDHFERATRKRIEAAIRFDLRCDAALAKRVDQGLALSDLYAAVEEEPVDEEAVAEELDAAWKRPPGTLGTQVSLADRFARLRAYKLDASNRAADERSAWCLIVVPEALRQRMTEAVRAEVFARTGVTIPRVEAPSETPAAADEPHNEPSPEAPADAP
ncbi:MAG: hypothetical protein JNK05_41565 [Myxococcales bacterium]|nr:hypothetical protein [Myxococcales bacterium]